jgi:hypothetical protein
MATLQVNIGANTQQLQKGLTDAEKAVKQFQDKIKSIQNQLRKNALVTAKVEKAIEQLEKDYKSGAIDAAKYAKSLQILTGRQNKLAENSKKLNSDLNQTNRTLNDLSDDGMSGLSNETNNAVPALTEFSRIIQDSPFGLQGMANNITAATERFQQLSARTGSATAALREMGRSLVGPAGILLAVSTVTSLLVAFGDKLSLGSKRAFELAEAIQGIGTKSLVEFKILTDTVLDTNASFEQQQRAITLLKKNYKDFDTRILTNKSNYDAARLSIDNYINGLKAQARAQAALQLIQEKQSKILKLEEETYARQLKEFGSAEAVEFALKRRSKLIKKQEQVFKKTLARVEKLEKEGRKVSSDAYDRAFEEQERRIARINQNYKDYNVEQIKELQNQIDRLAKLAKVRDELLFGSPVNRGLRPQATALQVTPLGINAGGGEAQAGGGQSAQAPILDNTLTQFREFSAEMELLLLDFNQRMDQIIQNNIVNTFAGIGEAIGNALSGAQNLGDGLAKVLLSSIGSILKQLGTLAITIGVTLFKIQASLININPGLAIAAGVAAIALGSVFSNAARSIGTSAGGGNVGGGGSLGGSNFGGTRTFNTGNNILGNVTFRIAGTDLVGVLNNQIDQNSIFGGNIQVSNG